MVKIGPAGPARQRGGMWRSTWVIFYFFVELLARRWRSHFCTDQHRFWIRWRVSVWIDFLGVWMLGLKFFLSYTPKTSNIWPIFGLRNFRPKRFTMGRCRVNYLNHHRSPLNIVGKSGSRFPNFWLLLAPYLQFTWHRACAMAIFVYTVWVKKSPLRFSDIFSQFYTPIKRSFLH